MGKSCGGAKCSEPGWAQDRQETSFVFLIYFFIGIQRGRVTSKVRSGEVRFGSELGARKERKVFSLIYI